MSSLEYHKVQCYSCPVREEFPQEHFIEIENEPDFLGRITVNKLQSQYSSEIDIVVNESRKIYRHVKMLYNVTDYKDIIDLSVQELARFLRNEK